jgi:FlaA1/EpsC-like NDP-sugar epimerase
VRIVDLVRNATRQLHFNNEELEIVFTGLRPGEKLSEALFAESEEMVATDHPRVWRTARRELPARFEWHLQRLAAAAESDEDRDVREALSELFPDLSAPPAATAGLGSFYPDGD